MIQIPNRQPPVSPVPLSVLPSHTTACLSASCTKPNQRSLLSWGMLDVLFLEIIVQTDDVSSRPSPRSDSTSPPSAQCWPFGVGVADEHLHTQQAPFTARGWLKRQSIGSRICCNTSFLEDVLPCSAGKDRSAVVLTTTHLTVHPRDRVDGACRDCCPNSPNSAVQGGG